MNEAGKETAMTKRILIVGSAPSAEIVQHWDLSLFDAVVAINNAWQLTPAWTHHIHPEDFPPERRPTPQPPQEIITYKDYVPAQNSFGGFLYAGGTMAFTAGYWAMQHFGPSQIAFLGCDMVYPSKGKTHFYGTGTADPLRDDPTLQDLVAKAMRMEALAAQVDVRLLNLSSHESVLPFDRVTLAELEKGHVPPRTVDDVQIRHILQIEKNLGYFVESGRYWDVIEQFDAAKLRKIDAEWRKVSFSS